MMRTMQNAFQIAIRPETPADVESIHALTTAAFETEAEANLNDLLREAGALTLSLTAWIEDRLAGHVAVSPVTIEGAPDAAWYGLGPIAVQPDLQGQGIGSQLMLKALADTAKLGGNGIVLLGDPKYYARFGFRPSTDFGLAWENGGGPYFQAVRLSDAAVPSGSVRFHPAFNDV